MAPAGIAMRWRRIRTLGSAKVAGSRFDGSKRLKPASTPRRCTATKARSRPYSHAKRPLEPAIYRLLLGVDFELPKGALYVPVPTPWHRRFRRRGCQTTCIAEALAKRFGGSVQHTLTRGRFAKRQARLDAASRRALPEDSFRLRTPVPDAAYVVLVDDVVTTGTTLRRAAKALGREDVHRFALAKVL